MTTMNKKEKSKREQEKIKHEAEAQIEALWQMIEAILKERESAKQLTA